MSLPDETFRRADRAAKRLGLSRSELFARAAERWLDDLDGESTTAAASAKAVSSGIGALPDWLLTQVDAGLARAIGLRA
jgi:hypothetical protein